MPLGDLISPNRCVILRSKRKRGALLELGKILASTSAVADLHELMGLIFRREASMSTGIGLGIAVPHARIEGLEEPAVALGVSPLGISDYKSIDEQTIAIVGMVVTAAGRPEQYSRLLAELISVLKLSSVRDELTLAGSDADICRIMQESIAGD